MTTAETTIEQDMAYYEFLRKNPHAVIVETPSVENNITFGPCVYFTVRNCFDCYIEYGIKPSGSIFKVC